MNDAMQRGLAWFRSEVVPRFQRLGEFLFSHRSAILTVVSFCIVVGFTIFVVRPFGDIAADNESPITAWNRTMSDLGIDAVYPPQEDFHVGDILATIAFIDPKSKAAPPATDSSLIGRSVRLGHIDMRDVIIASQKTPVFRESELNNEGELVKKQPDYEDDPWSWEKGIRLSRASFPGITIESHRDEAASWAAIFGLATNRDSHEQRHISIVDVLTYGAPAMDVFGKITIWCLTPEFKLRCEDATVRSLLALSADPRVLEVVDGQYTYSLQLQIVRKIYMTREFDVGSKRDDKTQFRMSDASEPPSQDGGQSNTAESKANGQLVGRTADGDFALELKHAFQRPLVFGYKAINIGLRKSTPQKGVQ